MAVNPKIFGPVEIFYGGTASGDLLGTAPDADAISWEEFTPKIGIPDDADGGLPTDFIQQGMRVLISMTLMQWDDAVVREIKGRLAVSGSSVVLATEGDAGATGLRVLANSPQTRTLTLRPSLITAQGNEREYTFNDVVINPNVDVPVRRTSIGSNASRLALQLMAFPNSEGVIYTTSDVTGS